MKRCPWVTPNTPIYETYHDDEWGVPVFEDQKHFEFLILESSQAGLSWLTILKRREGYKKAFANFDPRIVATFDEAKIAELVQNPEIIRHEKKIRAAVHNARLFLKIQEEYGSFSRYIWQFVNNTPIQNHPKNLLEIPTQSPESKALSLDLKKRGFCFLGPTTIYAHMQATGLINDHTTDCFCYLPLIKSSKNNDTNN